MMKMNHEPEMETDDIVNICFSTLVSLNCIGIRNLEEFVSILFILYGMGVDVPIIMVVEP